MPTKTRGSAAAEPPPHGVVTDFLAARDPRFSPYLGHAIIWHEQSGGQRFHALIIIAEGKFHRISVPEELALLHIAAKSAPEAGSATDETLIIVGTPTR